MEKRNCSECEHYVAREVFTGEKGGPTERIFGCEAWECEYKAKEDKAGEKRRS